jgi:hypothetical protein
LLCQITSWMSLSQISMYTIQRKRALQLIK